jgi:integrase
MAAKRRSNREGHFRKRADGRWECQMLLPSGKRKSLFGRTKAEVRAKHKEALHLIDAGIDIGVRAESVASFLQGWLEDVVKPTTRPRTHDSYVSMIRLHIAPAVGHHRLNDLTQPHVDAMMRTMTDKGLSPRTVQYARGILRAALTYAVRARLVDHNAAQYAKPPTRQQSERHYLTAAQSQLLLGTAQEHDPELAPLVTVALYTGLRIGELAGLRWQDVDLTGRRLQVRQTVYWIRGEYGFGEPKTKKSARTLTLPRPAVAALQEQHDRQAFLRKQAAHRWRDFDLVFSSVLGTPVDNSNVDRRLRTLLDQAGLPKGGFHMLRHSCASLMVAQGIALRTVMEQLGHSQMSLTSDLYAHVAPVMLEDAAEALERALNGGGDRLVPA